MAIELNKFYYLDVSLQINDQSNTNITKEIFMNCVLSGLENIFGEYGTCIPIDIVSYISTNNRATFRCPITFYVKFRAALTLTGEFQQTVCCFNVHKVASSLSELTSSN